MLAGLFWGDHPHDRARGPMNTTMTAGADFRSAGNGDSRQIWRVIQGEGAIEDVERHAVRLCLLTATPGEYTVTATTAATLLQTYVDEA